MNISRYYKTPELTYRQGYYNMSTGVYTSTGYAVCTDKFPVEQLQNIWLTSIDGKSINNPYPSITFAVHFWKGSTYSSGKTITMSNNPRFPYFHVPSDVDTCAIRLGKTADQPNNLSPTNCILMMTD